MFQVDVLKSKILLSHLTPEMWTAAHDAALNDFATSDTHAMLLIGVDPFCGLTISYNMPPNPPKEIAYFIRNSGTQEITIENFMSNVQFGTVSNRNLKSLLQLMSSVYVPMCTDNTSWPDSIHNEFLGQMHKFMASLTDTRWKSDGKTVLYIPLEGINVNPAIASKNKELVQRLESKALF